MKHESIHCIFSFQSVCIPFFCCCLGGVFLFFPFSKCMIVLYIYIYYIIYNFCSCVVNYTLYYYYYYYIYTIIFVAITFFIFYFQQRYVSVNVVFGCFFFEFFYLFLLKNFLLNIIYVRLTSLNLSFHIFLLRE